MARRMPRSFFWIDQKLIRTGLWLKLSADAKLVYVALSAACDREGRCLMARPRLSDLAGISNDIDQTLKELFGLALVEVNHDPHFSVQMLSLDEEALAAEMPSQPAQAGASAGPPSVVVHTHLTVNLGEHVERGTAG